jgi:hypothetical protein
MSNDQEFYKQIDFIFESYLSARKDGLKIRIRDISKNIILEDSDMNYSKVFFDADLNIYKLDKSGSVVRVDNQNFETIVLRKE